MNKIFDYTNLTLNELIEKISIARFFHLPKMVAEALRKSSTPKYKVYTALLTQIGDEEVITTNVFENTLGGNVTTQYVATGVYGVKSNSLFSDKPFLIIAPGGSNKGSFTYSFFSSSEIRLNYNDTSEEVPINVDGDFSVEIRVYN